MELRTAFPTAVALGTLLGTAMVGLKTSSINNSAPTGAEITVAELTEGPVRWDLPVVSNSSVERFVNLFTREQSDRMALYLKRSGRYEGMIRTKLRARGMPEDLLYLSMIESGFNPNALSRARAVGLWQFMAGTARDYGLRVDSYVDERRDPEKSTDAALRYLQDLYSHFGSWNLAAAAYNSGQGRVGRIMRKETGAERGAESDFWRIRDQLPRETREYVPLIYAAALVGKQPDRYGLGNVERWLPVPMDTVTVPGGTELVAVAKAVGAREADLRALNPHLVKGITPPGKVYPVRIPEGRTADYAVNFSRVSEELRRSREAESARKRADAATRTSTKAKPKPRVAERSGSHRVKDGESLWTIARRHGVSVARLQQANKLGKRTVIQPGQLLKIPA